MSSQRHILQWISSSDFLTECEELILPAHVCLSGARFWPNTDSTKERQIQDPRLRSWWAPRGGKTPTWDLMIEGRVADRDSLRDVLILFEAKAHHEEWNIAGKTIHSSASSNSISNQEQIEKAIKEAQRGLQQWAPDCRITHEEHYQLANRLACAWKLAQLGTAVILVFYGVINVPSAAYRRSISPFTSEKDWEDSFKNYRTGKKTHVPDTVFNRKLIEATSGTPLWILSRCR